jgi:hypothetical protein
MKYTIVKMSEIAKHPTMRLDAKYWIKKNQKKEKNISKYRRASTHKLDRPGALGYNRI